MEEYEKEYQSLLTKKQNFDAEYNDKMEKLGLNAWIFNGDGFKNKYLNKSICPFFFTPKPLCFNKDVVRNLNNINIEEPIVLYREINKYCDSNINCYKANI